MTDPDARPFRVHYRRAGGPTPTRVYRSSAIRRWALLSPYVERVEDLDGAGEAVAPDGGDTA